MVVRFDVGALRAGAVVIVLAGLPAVAYGQSDQGAAVAQATAQLEALNRRMADVVRGATPDMPGSAGAELEALAGERLQRLAALVDSAPGEVLRVALPSSVRDSLPAAARAATEEQVDLTGTVEVLYEDHRGFSRLRHWLDTGAARYSMHFASEPPAWTSGQRIRVRGVRVQRALALNGDSSSVSAAAAAPDVAGEQRTLMVLVNFLDQAQQPYTVEQARGLLFTSTDGFMRENSAGAISLSGDVLGWFTIPMSSTVCDTTTLATLARQAATAAGAVLGNYSRFVYAFPANACSWWGLGSVGGNPSQAWINGDLMLDVAGHELGHNLGLYHSHSLDCGAAPIGPTCTASDYGDTLDIMGATRGHFNAFQKERLGWLTPGQIVTVTSGGTYNVEPFESLTGGVKALKVLKSVDPATGKRTFYYVELRQAIGYDAFMSGWTNVLTGVSIHTGSEAGGNTSYLLDMTPQTTSWYDPALVGGQTFSDTAAGVSLTVHTVSPAGAVVWVSVAAAACTRSLPSVSLSPGAAVAVSPGTTVGYAVTITNNDAASCSASTFALSPTVPSGWTAAFGPSSVTLAPGASTSATLSVASSANASAGSHSLSARAVDVTDAAHSGSGSATYSVAVPVGVQVSTDRASYARGGTVVMSALVASGASPVSGASVAFRIRKPDGKNVNATGSTNAAGVATYVLRLRPKEPIGTYQVTATLSASGATAATAFSVY